MKRILLILFCFLVSACHDRNNFSSSDLNMGPGQTNLQLPASPSGSGTTTDLNTGVRSGGSIAPSGGGTGRALGPIIDRPMSRTDLGTIGAGDIGSGTPTDEIKNQTQTVHFLKIFDGDDSFFGGVRLFYTAYSYMIFKEVIVPTGIEECYIKTHIKMKSPTSPLLRDAYTLTLMGVQTNGAQTVLKEWDGSENVISATRRSDGKYNIIFEVKKDCGAEGLANISDYSKYRIHLKYHTEEETTRVDATGLCSRNEECLAGQDCDGRRCYSEEIGRTARSYAFGGVDSRTIFCASETECVAGQLCDSHCYWASQTIPVNNQDNYLELDTPAGEIFAW